MAEPVRVLITGATGFIGREVARRLLDAGYAVRSLTRTDWRGAPGIAAKERRLGRLPFDLPAGLCTGVDAVVHCAAVSSSAERLSHAVNALGTRRLAELARDAGTRTFIFFSSQSARVDTASAYGRSKHEAEQSLFGLAGLQSIIFRPGLVTGRGGLFGRMTGVMEQLPAVPVMAARSIVQPIWVGDLADAVVACLRAPERFAGAVQCLGMDPGVPLAELLRLLSRALGRRRQPLVGVPLGPLRLTVATAEKVGLRLPVSSANLTGAEAVQPMATAASMAALGVPLRSAEEIVRLGVQRPRAADGADGADRGGATGTLLIGAGRIGVVHAVTLSRLQGATLAGIVDRQAGALGLLRSMGVRAPVFRSLDEAQRGCSFEAAVIATPPASHLPLAQSCLSAGARVLIEKPAAASLAQVGQLAALAGEVGDRALVGYLLPRAPHIRRWIDRLRRGELGALRRFEGSTLLSLIGAESPERWETQRASSGGGVLVNSAGHVASLIVAAFGSPRASTAQLVRLHSREVEDSAIVSLEYDGFSGVLYASWSIAGFNRQENRLVVWTDRGRLTFTLSTVCWEPESGGVEIDHQLDEDVGFNLAPDYAGGGISVELADLAGSSPPTGGHPITLARGLEVERLLFSFDEQPEVMAFTLPVAPAERPSVLPPMDWETAGLRLADLRDLPAAAALRALSRQRWDGVVVFPADLAAACGSFPAEGIVVTAPDFMRQTRRIGERRYLEVLRGFGLGGTLRAGSIALPRVLAQRGVGFWAAAAALLSGDLQRVPKAFSGRVLLHPYLADLALALDRLDRLEDLLGIIHRACPQAHVGFHSNLRADAVNAAAMLATPPTTLALLASAGGSTLRSAALALSAEPELERVELLAEVGFGPLLAHREAARTPQRWAGEGRPLIISALVDDEVGAAAEEERTAAWAHAFPGAAPPASLF